MPVYEGDDEANVIAPDPVPPGSGGIYIYGYGGDDLLQMPLGGWGVVEGGPGDDTLRGGMGSFTAYMGGGGADTIILGPYSGNANLFGGAGNDYLRNGELSGPRHSYGGVLDGGAGDDTMVGSMPGETYVVSSRRDVIEDQVRGDSDRVRSFVSFRLGTTLEHLTLEGSGDLTGIGNRFGNDISGNWSDNRLHGLGGNDTLDGDRGSDTLTGGLGKDVLYSGSAGYREGELTTFEYKRVEESDVAHGIDTIRAFDAGDVIDLAAIDANGLALDGDDAFVFIGDADFGPDATGQLRFEVRHDYRVLIHASIDADAEAEFTILLRAPTRLPVSGDFLL